MSKLDISGGTVEVIYVATTNEVAIVAETLLPFSSGAQFRVRLIMPTVHARKLRAELDRALVDAELSGKEGPL